MGSGRGGEEVMGRRSSSGRCWTELEELSIENTRSCIAAADGATTAAASSSGKWQRGGSTTGRTDSSQHGCCCVVLCCSPTINY